MNYLILGINGEVGKAIFKALYNSNDKFILTYISKKSKLKNKNIFLYQLNFEKVENNISKIIKILRKFKKIDTVNIMLEMQILMGIF